MVDDVRPHHGPRIQLALLLDTSNSMDGLIDQARSRLWSIVGDLARAHHGGRRPRLEVALYEYGNNRLSRDSGYIREVCSFTDDLDLVSEHLFSLRTNGGDEYCGAVIDRALGDLAWSNRPDDLRLIFIAGNEPFTQGPVDFRPVVRRAARRDITVNSIFCGPAHQGIATHWQQGALLAGGAFANIDQNRRIPHIDAPQDTELATLNSRLNLTYLGYGPAGRARAETQRIQDSNALAAAPSSFASRVAAKAGALYNNYSWDLVDASREGTIKVEELERDALPDELKDLSAEQRRERIEAAAREREQLQARIRELAREREAYVAAELARISDGTTDSALDKAVLASVRAQAVKKNYAFDTE